MATKYRRGKTSGRPSTLSTVCTAYIIGRISVPHGGEQVERVGLAEVGRARLTAEAVQNSILLSFVESLVFLFLMSLVHIFVLVEFK